MKNKFFIFVCILLLICISGCSNNSSDTNIEQDDVIKEVVSDPKGESSLNIVDSINVELGENLPTIKLDEKAIKIELSEQDLANSLIDAYQTADTNTLLFIYKFPSSGHSLKEAVDAQIDVYYPEQELVGGVFNNWEEEGDYEYGYYMAFDNSSYSTPYFVQTFILKDGEDFVQVDYWDEATKFDIDDSLYIYLPTNLMKSQTISSSDSNDTFFKAVDSGLDEMPSLLFRKWEKKNSSYDDLIKEYSEKYEIIDNEVYPYLDGENLYLEYKDDANKYYSFVSYSNNYFYSFDFSVDAIDGKYNAYAIPALIYTVNIDD